MQPPVPSYRNMQSNTQGGVPGSGNFNGNPNTVYNRTPGPFYNPSQPWGPNNGLQYARQPDRNERMYQAGYTNVRPMPNANQHYLMNQPQRPPQNQTMPPSPGRAAMPIGFPGGNTVNRPPSQDGRISDQPRFDPGLNASPIPYGQGQNPWWQTFGFPVGQNAQPSNPYAGEQKPGQPNVMPKPGMDQRGNKPAPDIQRNGYGNTALPYNDMGYRTRDFRDSNRNGIDDRDEGGMGQFEDPFAGTYDNFDPNNIDWNRINSIWGGGLDGPSIPDSNWSSGRNQPLQGIDFPMQQPPQYPISDQNQWRGIQPVRQPPQWNRRNDFPMPNFSPSYGNQFGYGFSGDSRWNQPWMGGQNANLGRYAPPMFDMSGRGINQGQGGYAYNLPNAYGPFPMFSQFGMGNNFRTPYGSMPPWWG